MTYSVRGALRGALCLAVIFIGGCSLKTYGQGCPTITNHGWPQNTVVRYWFDNGFTDEQKRQIRAAAAAWNTANHDNNSKVSFLEDTTGQDFKLRFLIGTLASGNPARFDAVLDGTTGTVKSGTITYDPNNTFPGSNILEADPAQPGYDTIVMKLIMHEMGHQMGLDHPAVPANPCDQPDGATVMNYSCGINDQGNNMPTVVTACDQNAINSESIYPRISLPAPTVQLAATSFSVGEGDGHASITVTRSGDTTGQVSVGYATGDTAGLASCGTFNGIASSRCDYTGVIGTLQFAAGETSKTFIVPIIDDSYAEGTESFSIALSSPTGASLSTPSSATVVITDNDATTGANPVDNSSFFIRQQYLDFLNREPDPGGMQFYLNILNGCQPSDTECTKYTRGALSANFFRSPEFQQKGSFVMYLYMVSIGQRPSTVAELNDRTKVERPRYSEFIVDLQSISDPNDDKAVVSAKKDALTIAWLQRPEIQQKYGGLTNDQFVRTLEATAGVTVSNEGALINALNSGSMTRAQVLRNIVESPEVNNKFYKQAFVTMEYFGYLRRDPEDCHDSRNWTGGDPAQCGYIFHNNRFQLAADPDFLENTIVRGFIESPEYRQRFGP